MSTFFSAVQQFSADENGITAIEYGLIAALMAAAIGGMITVVKGNATTGLIGVFTSIAASLNAALAP
ncbi:Flp family type IVb pilin [Janthinobacterium sp.]|uniref:Flp family type IVb pilin n=1 Tax=Janthinobacterium sp. TaxID=1871054 RepID=UPI00293D6BE8|nr:Flp family type IVb pilin [Janthinobacterium sp.]